MKTLVYAALRSYRDIITIERSRRGLERVITATSTIYQNFSMESFASAVLEQISNLLYIEHDSIYASAVRAMAASHGRQPQPPQVAVVDADAVVDAVVVGIDADTLIHAHANTAHSNRRAGYTAGLRFMYGNWDTRSLFVMRVPPVSSWVMMRRLLNLLELSNRILREADLRLCL